MSSPPSSVSPRATSTSPRLSDTLRSARRIRTSPGATVPATGGCASTIAVHAHESRLVADDGAAPRRDQADGLGQQPVLNLVKMLASRSDVAMVGKLEGFLQDDRPAVHPLVHEVHRHPG